MALTFQQLIRNCISCESQLYLTPLAGQKRATDCVHSDITNSMSISLLTTYEPHSVILKAVPDQPTHYDVLPPPELPKVIAPTSSNMPTAQSITQNHHLTNILIILFLVALFPGLPQYLLLLPLRPIYSIFSNSTPPPLPQITCPPNCVPAAFPHPHTTTYTAADKMSWFQKSFTLPSKSRGSYLITDDVVKALPELKDYKVGLLNLFVQHTSCALSLNENWDSEVREDMSDALDRLAPEDKKGNLYRHSAEGLDDMPVSCERDQSLDKSTRDVGERRC